MSILIKNGVVYDGSGQPSYKKDILIRGDRISKIGNISEKGVEKTIDAKNSYIFPGFIDINSDSDHHLNLFQDPSQKKYIEQGITTIIGGNEGISLAPLYHHKPLDFIKERAPKHLESININWESFKEFLSTTKNRGVGVNFGSLVGYSTIRKLITHNKSEVSSLDLKSISKLIKDSIKEGALGLSFGFDEIYSKNIKSKEIEAILEDLKNINPLIVSNLNDPENKPLKSIKSILKAAKKANISSIEINGIQPIKSEASVYKSIVDLINQKAKDVDVKFDLHPYPLRKIPVYKLLPQKILKNKGRDAILEEIKNESNREDILDHLKTKTRKKIKIIHTSPEFSFLEGKYIKEIADNKNKTQAQTLLELMISTSLELVCLFEDINKQVLDNLISSDISIISTDGLQLEDRNLNPFIEFIKNSNKNENTALEKSIAKITSIPAKKYKIEDRGEIKEKNYADITIFKKGKPIYVIVNGEIVMDNGKIKEKLPGKIIKSKAIDG